MNKTFTFLFTIAMINELHFAMLSRTSDPEDVGGAMTSDGLDYENPEIAVLPTLNPYKAICIKFGYDTNKKALAYDVIRNNVRAINSGCPVDHKWIPRPVDGDNRVFYLISTRNNQALTQNQDNTVSVEDMVHGKNQRWIMQNDGCNLFQIKNLETKDYLVLYENNQVGLTKEHGSKDVKSAIFVIGKSTCNM
jgi:hypothetical protein